MQQELLNLLKQGASRLGVALDETALRRFDLFTGELLKWNEVMNLTAITDPGEIVVKHYIDSLSLIQYVQADGLEGKTLIDVGCGAGFPSIPMKIATPGLKVTFLDALQKRLNFISASMTALGLDGTVPFHSRAEDAGKNPLHREKYDIATARAVSQLRVLAEYCLPLVRIDGLFAAMKGPEARQEIDEAVRAVELLGGKILSINELTLPQSELRRTVIVIKKVKQTPAQYPRLQAKINKQPL